MVITNSAPLSKLKMSSRLPENFALRKNRVLTQALILSGMLNIGLLATFIYVVLSEKQESLAIELKPLKEQAPTREHKTNAALLKAYSVLPFQELLLRLENKDRMEEGLYKRDLALSCLTAFHHFNLDKALCGTFLQKRTVLFSNVDGQEKIEIPVYPGLSDDQFQAVLRFAKTEKWPLTSQGLFYELQRLPHSRDPSLAEAFCLSPEYQAVHTLFSKTGIPLSSEYLINLLCEGDWKILSDLAQSQRTALNLSVDRRRSLLLAYLDCRSKTSAKLLIETDLDFLLKRCDDAQILILLDSYVENSSYLDNFAKGLLASPRTDAIWKRAAAALYTLANENMPNPYNHRLVLQRFFPKDLPVHEISGKSIETIDTNRPISKPNRKLYVVENGDNLWKISKKFRVSVEEIMQINHLESEKLRPGRQLEIPVKDTNSPY